MGANSYLRCTAQSMSSCASSQRASIVLLYKITTMMKLPSFSKQLARHAPAASVMPVFTPVKPSIPSSRFVFTQLYDYSFSL